MRQIRIGIDVGGTFTDIVAVDASTGDVVGHIKVPTTHDAAEGVAAGIVAAIEQIVERLNLQPDEVLFLAHSTTQATNALLEGDVAHVGVVAVGSGLASWRVRRDADVGALELAEGRCLRAELAFINTSDGRVGPALESAFAELESRGAQVVVATEAFSVDTPANEARIVEAARRRGTLATATHEVSSLYGLKLRTRTAAINAAILPRMLQTSDSTQESVRRCGINAPLMIMRSDGGVMDVEEMRRRPILTLLSGPAAGIAGALMYENLTDGIFLEVGGTSTDISVIRDGLPQTRPARVGGHRIFLNTLDVRTIGLGGGSMLRVSDQKLIGVGPRSAHIAGCRYICFAHPAELTDLCVEAVSTSADDTNHYLVLINAAGDRFAATLTCAANVAGYVQPHDYAFGNVEAARLGLEKVAAYLSMDLDVLLERIFDLATRQVQQVLRRLVTEYQLSEDLVELVGGGGGAAAVLPAVRADFGWRQRIARNAPIISAIGVALAMVKEVVERSIVNASEEEVLRVRREAEAAAIRSGALPSTVEVRVEIDRQRNLIRAVASGATEIRDSTREAGGGRMDDAQRRLHAARAMGLAEHDVHLVAENSSFYVYQGTTRFDGWKGWLRRPRVQTRVLDPEGVARLRKGPCVVLEVTPDRVHGELQRQLLEQSAFTDAGRVLPEVYLLYGGRIANFSGLSQPEHVLKLAEAELRGVEPDERILLLLAMRG